MNASELRIGNWVKRETQPEGFVVDSSAFFRCEQHPEWYDPIPITSDWLLRFGFKLSGYGGQGNAYTDALLGKKSHKDYFYLFRHDQDNPEREWQFESKDHGKSTYIKYVHQLQNLYFAITGEELKQINS